MEGPGGDVVLSYVEANHQLVIGLDRHDIRVDGQRVELLATEFRVLRLLARSPGHTFSRTEILDGIHTQRYAIAPRAVDGRISKGCAENLVPWPASSKRCAGRAIASRPSTFTKLQKRLLVLPPIPMFPIGGIPDTMTVTITQSE